MINRKDKALIVVGFFLTKILYTAKAMAPANIHRSPIEKRKDNKRLQLALDISNRIPAMQMIIPTNLLSGNFSFKKTIASIVAKMGEEVVPINAILIAEV